MDSKLKLQVIACVSVIVFLVLGLVLLVNQDEKGKKRPSQTVQTETQMNNSIDQPVSSFDERYELDPYADPYAFVQDEEFFDKEEEPEEDNSDMLSLLVSTTQKDIRVHVVDHEGNPVTGQQFRFRLSLDGKEIPKTFLDEDKDGMLYLEDMESGDYEVSLRPLEDYDVPEEGVTVSVSDEISYTVLDDISFLIVSEDEIDPTVEDTAINQAEIDADGTETNRRLSDGATVFGIDVSKWNKDIDWEKVKAAGVEFAIIRCGYRGSASGALVEDPYFAKNIKGATDAGVRVGLYFFTQAVTPVEAVEEASMVLMLGKQYKLSYPIFIDTEGAGGNGRADGLDKETRTAVCRAFCETIENAGYTAGVYASKHWLENNLDTEQLSSYSTWLAQYSAQPTYEGEYDMWQYTSAGKIDGISTLVDYNVSYMDY
ncbi:MAG: glycoside hydrolase family 25 protein [Lachnospiraceae bacterium]|nr:glycoside hydrolase family 25 protein [Lachnospiraceae bacterium]